jgi:hypothetical protein
MDAENGRSAPSIVADGVSRKDGGGATEKPGDNSLGMRRLLPFWLGVFVGAIVAFVAGSE